MTTIKSNIETDWNLNTRDLVSKETDFLTVDDKEKICYSVQPLCLRTQADTHLDIGIVMALSNNSPDSAEASEVNFTSSLTEFGTDNCATHHIFVRTLTYF